MARLMAMRSAWFCAVMFFCLLLPAAAAHGDTTDVATEIRHWPSALLWIGIMIAVVFAGRAAQRRSPEDEERFRKRLVIVGTSFWFWTQGYFANAPLWEALPLHVCDFGGAIATLALLSERRWIRGVLYFWALGLTTNAFITPVNEHAFPHPRWWTFWGGHSYIILAALYDLFVRRYRPTGADLSRVALFSIIYVTSVFAINEIFKDHGFNYAYIGRKDDQPSFIGLLGEWPLRVVWMCSLVAVGFIILWLPWEIARWVSPRRQDPDE